MGATGIAALPPTTVRQIGSMQVLTDPSSVVKELMDNALDARANAIFVEISCNTIDSIQVKDTGHGIAQEDRPLVCRRYCTSKIRDFHDLKSVGGTWLGFRGEALASMAAMSGALEVTTRVEGEAVASKMRYDHKGELLGKTEPASAPIGTTVKVTDFFKHLPVRKQTALKDSARSPIKIRQLMQAYAIARPTVRFSLRVLKAKSNKNDFTYAPKKDGSVEDAVLKIFGKDCALQCEWTTFESDGFEIHAFLPKPGAASSKIANQGAFISVDARPVSTARGTPKKIVKAFKERLQKSNARFASVKDPFFCMNIICPPNSYDPNIEPAKNDVLFEDEDLIINAVNKLLVSYYSEQLDVMNRTNEVNDVEDVIHVGPSINNSDAQNIGDTEHINHLGTPVAIQNNLPTEANDIDFMPDAPQAISPERDEPQWRSTMYGIDEEDLEFVHNDLIPVIEEEEDRRNVSVSNPWTIAKMNVRNKQSFNNQQLMTPAKDRNTVLYPLSPPTATISRQQATAMLPTPRTASKTSRPKPPQVVRACTSSYIDCSHSSEHLNGQLGTSPLLSASHSIQDSSEPRNNAPGQSQFDELNDKWSHQPKRINALNEKSGSHGAKQPRKKPGKGDIRNFFGTNRSQARDSRAPRNDSGPPSFTPINIRQQGLPRRLGLHGESQRQDVGARRRDSSCLSEVGLTASHHLERIRNELEQDSNHELVLQLEAASHGVHNVASQEASRPFSANSLAVNPRNLQSFPFLPDQRSKNIQSASRTSKRSGSSLKHNDIAAELNAYAERENRALASRPARVPPTHEASTTHSSRHEDGNGTLRRRSSRIFVDANSKDCIPHIEVLVKVSLDHIVHSMQLLDMSMKEVNNLQWSYNATIIPHKSIRFLISKRTADSWAAKLCKFLDRLYEQEEAANVETEIQNGIYKTVPMQEAQADSGGENNLTAQLMAAAAATPFNPSRSPRIPQLRTNTPTLGSQVDKGCTSSDDINSSPATATQESTTHITPQRHTESTPPSTNINANILPTSNPLSNQETPNAKGAEMIHVNGLNGPSLTHSAPTKSPRPHTSINADPAASDAQLPLHIEDANAAAKQREHNDGEFGDLVGEEEEDHDDEMLFGT